MVRFSSRLTCLCPFAFGLLTLLLLNALSHRAAAGEITGLTWYSGIASVAGEFIAPPVDPNNNDVVGESPNVIYVLQKNYMGIGPVDLVFEVQDTGGVTEYRIEEGVSNATGLDWSGYHLELGYGHGADFVKASPGDLLSFDAPDFNSPVSFLPFFTSVSVSEHDLIASGGIITSPGYAGGIKFHIDVPDGITSFTLRQSPIPVPEPSAAVLAGVGLLSLARFRLRRRAQKYSL